MIGFEEAQELVVGAASDARSALLERVSLDQAVGRVLREAVLAPVDLPAHDTSAMDGYALCSRQLLGEGPWELPVVGESRAGGDPGELAAGAAARIFTGAGIPRGADAVIIQENVERSGQRISLTHRPHPGEHVRRAGEDLAKGAVALEVGARLSAYSLALLASVERVEVLVAARPRVGILCTGDELRPPGQAGAPGLAESNGVALAALVRQVGGEPIRLPLVPDEPEATRRALDAALNTCQVVLTVGGVSVGDRDFVRPALDSLGVEVLFSRCRIKPGKPVLLGARGASLLLGLPGNPASALVTFTLFGAPLLRALQGDGKPIPAWRRGALAAPLKQKPGRLSFYRAHLEGDVARVFHNQASGATTALAWANGLVRIDEDAAYLPEGHPVEVLGYGDV